MNVPIAAKFGMEELTISKFIQSVQKVCDDENYIAEILQ